MGKSVYIDFILTFFLCVILLLILLSGTDFNFSDLFASIGEFFLRISGK